MLYFSGSADLEAEGRVISGCQFDDGCHAEIGIWFILAMNANSSHKEGAWEFIRYLLSDEVQGKERAGHDAYVAPVSRKAFEEWMSWSIKEMTETKVINGVPSYPPVLKAKRCRKSGRRNTDR